MPYADKEVERYRAKLRYLERMKDPEYREKRREKQRLIQRERMKNPEHREKHRLYMIKYNKEKRKDPVFAQKKRDSDKRYRRLYPEKIKEIRVKCAVSQRTSELKRLGITLEDYNTLLEKQEGRCAICRTTDPSTSASKNFSVDHDHSSGTVRGLLCHRCNTGLGQFQEKAELIRKTITYLKDHESNKERINERHHLFENELELAKRPLSRREQWLIKKYKITESMYEDMLEEQGGVCFLCEKYRPVYKKARLCVDHDKETGEVRGILCRNCNLGIGSFRDNTSFLERAVEHLEKPEEPIDTPKI